MRAFLVIVVLAGVSCASVIAPKQLDEEGRTRTKKDEKKDDHAGEPFKPLTFFSGIGTQAATLVPIRAITPEFEYFNLTVSGSNLAPTFVKRTEKGYGTEYGLVPALHMLHGYYKGFTKYGQNYNPDSLGASDVDINEMTPAMITVQAIAPCAGQSSLKNDAYAVANTYCSVLYPFQFFALHEAQTKGSYTFTLRTYSSGMKSTLLDMFEDHRSPHSTYNTEKPHFHTKPGEAVIVAHPPDTMIALPQWALEIYLTPFVLAAATEVAGDFVVGALSDGAAEGIGDAVGDAASSEVVG